ncbi:pentapeptide repeat-containing protein [Granulicella sp. S190]|uniref:pentapeptide repeat-containing protein n=1 Tax=Granulicella sp. S190 TaxID=1747226 RepID=UPI00131C99D2|nr:pentapeptide repeat-containing protein [Granulicella sp. S190]
MKERSKRSRPKPWSEHKQELHSWSGPFKHLEWHLSWVAWALGNWALLDVLENLGTFSVLIAVIFYFSDRGNRQKQRHYQAWQVINTAQGKGGSGGRIEAMQELNADHISLTGVDAGQAFLVGVSLKHANLSRCDLHASDLRNSDFSDSVLSFCTLEDANLRSANLTNAKVDDVKMTNVDMNGANLQGADISGSDLTGADLRGANLKGVQWQRISAIKMANIFNVRNAPQGFIKFALDNGAVSMESEEKWDELTK